MSATGESPEPSGPPPIWLRFRLVHVFYAMALLASALSVFGGRGLIFGVAVLGFWTVVFSSRSRPLALLHGCLSVLLGGCVLACLLPIQHVHEPARRAQCVNNLKQIVLALRNYHNVHGSFPPAFVPDEQGRPMHSWRVLLLQFIEQEALYDQYDFSEPWDGPNNRKLLSQIPPAYMCPSEPRVGGRAGTSTSYLAVVGPRTAWPGASGRKLAEIPDGPWNTILLIEKHGSGISWMEPRDMSFDEALAQLSADDPSVLGPHHSENFFFEYYGGCNVALADTVVHYVRRRCSRELWAALLTIDDDGLRFADVPLEPLPPFNAPRLKVGNCYRLAVFVLLVLLPLPWVWRNRGPRSDAPAPSGRSTAETVR